jgi:hypothetical protein
MRLILAVSFCVTFVPSLGYAAPITYDFGTHLSIVNAGLSPFVESGSAMTWSFTIDSDATDLLPLDPAVGSYALGTSYWSAGSLTGTATGGSIQFSNDGGGVDSIFVDASGMTFSSSQGFTPTLIHLILQGVVTALSSTELPTNLDINLFHTTGMGMAFEGYPLDWLAGLSVLGPVEVAMATPGTIPEPTSLLLVCAGVAAFAVNARRRRKHLG